MPALHLYQVTFNYCDVQVFQRQVNECLETLKAQVCTPGACHKLPSVR